MPNPNSHAGSHDVLRIDGSTVDSLKAVGGLDLLGDVAIESSGGDSVRGNHLVDIRWSPGKATIGMGMGQGMYGWVRTAFDQGASIAHGSLAIGDYKFKKRSVLSFAVLAPDLQTPLGTIALAHVGVLRFAPLPSLGGETLTCFVVELYVEQMSLRLLRYEG